MRTLELSRDYNEVRILGVRVSEIFFLTETRVLRVASARDVGIGFRGLGFIWFWFKN